MDICEFCGLGQVEKGHECCPDCERLTVRIERQLTLAGDGE